MTFFSGNIKEGQILKERIITTRPMGASPSYNFLQLPDGGSLTVLQYLANDQHGKLELLRLHNSDMDGTCTGKDTSMSKILDLRYTTIDLPPLLEKNNIVTETFRATFTAANEKLERKNNCKQASFCDSLKLHILEDSVCARMPVTITYSKNPFCTSKVLWQFDNSSVTKTNVLNDSTLQLVYNKQWQGYISGILSGCSILKDSVAVHVLESTKNLDIGNDTVLCTNQSLFLNAGNGFSSYAWQDGSADSVFLVTLPGKYYVTVTDFCGNIKSDTIVVSPPKNVSFNFQLLYEKCSIDTIKIAIPALVKNIVFHPFEGVNYNEEIIKAFPSKNTFYYVKAKTIEGCYLTDSFNIKVNESIPVSLGNDTAICEGNTLALEPSAEFLTYHWSDGASSSSKIVNSTGKYWIEVTGKNQCTSSDTIAVTVNPAPLVNLGKDKSICPEAVYTLDPGNAYASYLWQDGSNGSTYKAGQLGAYSVIVTDENGCSGSDTVNIVAYKNVPSNFLNKTDSVCAYEPKEVYAKGDWNSYLWSNGSTSRSTIIKEAGTYWLEVSNSDGCHAKDTIDVKRKDCINGIYFPSAFTPNQDGKNDLYKPIVHVSLDKYYLVIYNRFGQKVFETTDLGKGWNGTLNSLQQDTGGVYVWYCKYKIIGLAERTEKGTLVLIR